MSSAISSQQRALLADLNTAIRSETLTPADAVAKAKEAGIPDKIVAAHQGYWASGASHYGQASQRSIQATPLPDGNLVALRVEMAAIPTAARPTLNAAAMHAAIKDLEQLAVAGTAPDRVFRAALGVQLPVEKAVELNNLAVDCLEMKANSGSPVSRLKAMARLMKFQTAVARDSLATTHGSDVVVWDAKTMKGTVVKSALSSVKAVAFSADGALLGVSSRPNVRLVDDALACAVATGLISIGVDDTVQVWKNPVQR